MPEQPWSTSCKWKVEISQRKKKEIKSYAEVSKIYGKDMTCLWTCEEGKWNFAGFTVVS